MSASLRSGSGNGLNGPASMTIRSTAASSTRDPEERSISIFSTALAFVIFFRLIHTLGTVGTTAQAYLRVPIGVGIGVLFLGETLASTAWVGMTCVIVGVAAMTIPARRRATAEGV